MRLGLASILFGALAILLTASAVISAIVTLHLVTDSQDRVLARLLQTHAEALTHEIEANCTSLPCDTSAFLLDAPGFETWILDRNFRATRGQSPSWLAREPAVQDAFTASQHQRIRRQVGRNSVLVDVRPLNLSGTQRLVQVVMTRRNTEDNGPTVRTLIWLQIANLLLILGFGVYVVHTTVIAPISKLEHWIRQKYLETFTRRPPLKDGPREVLRLQSAFERLVDTLEAKREHLASSKDHLAQIQQQLAHRDRLVTVGRVASGIAHEVGNPLSSVIGFLSLLKSEADLDELGMSKSEVLGKMDQELERIRKAVRSLLDLSQPVRVSPQKVNLQAVIDDVETLLRVRSRKVTIETSNAVRSVCEVYVDPSLLLQVLSNLCLNAAEAMGDAGCIRIDLDRETEDFVYCVVIDEGPGISPEIRPVLLEPFQTTKRDRGGTGLGLSISRSLLNVSGGELSVPEPQPDVGAAFMLKLPKHQGV